MRQMRLWGEIDKNFDRKIDVEMTHGGTNKIRVYGGEADETWVLIAGFIDRRFGGIYH